jgi:hypothetical protein
MQCKRSSISFLSTLIISYDTERYQCWQRTSTTCILFISVKKYIHFKFNSYIYISFFWHSWHKYSSPPVFFGILFTQSLFFCVAKNVIRIRKSKKDGYCNCQKNKDRDKRTNKDLQNTRQKTKDRGIQPDWNPRMNSFRFTDSDDILWYLHTLLIVC